MGVTSEELQNNPEAARSAFVKISTKLQEVLGDSTCENSTQIEAARSHLHSLREILRTQGFDTSEDIEIGAMTDDVARSAKNTGIPEHYIAKVKEHLFLKEHELEVANYKTQEIRREKGNFTPLPEIAEGWMEAINKPMQVEELADELANFRHLIAHEYIEAGLMDDGLPYMNPNSWREHPRYGWGNYPMPGDKGYGAHNLAPNPNPKRSAFGHWERDLGMSPEGLSLAEDLSNLNEVLKKIRKIIEEKE